MTVTWRFLLPLNDACSIGLASALFDMSDTQFVREYIRTGKIHADRLHQVSFSRVLFHYNQTPERRRTTAQWEWRHIQDLNAIASTFRIQDGCVLSPHFRRAKD